MDVITEKTSYILSMITVTTEDLIECLDNYSTLLLQFSYWTCCISVCKAIPQSPNKTQQQATEGQWKDRAGKETRSTSCTCYSSWLSQYFAGRLWFDFQLSLSLHTDSFPELSYSCPLAQDSTQHYKGTRWQTSKSTDGKENQEAEVLKEMEWWWDCCGNKASN